MSGTRVPETIADFNSYINTTDDYLKAPATPPTNATRLGLSAQNQTDWSDKRTYWRKRNQQIPQRSKRRHCHRQLYGNVFIST